MYTITAPVISVNMQLLSNERFTVPLHAIKITYPYPAQCTTYINSVEHDILCLFNININACCRCFPNKSLSLRLSLTHTFVNLISVIYNGNTIISAHTPAWLHSNANNAVSAEYSGEVDACILNIERDGGILFSWKVSPQCSLCKIYPGSEHRHCNAHPFSALFSRYQYLILASMHVSDL